VPAEPYIGIAHLLEAQQRWDEAAATHQELGKTQPEYRVISAAKATLCNAKAGKVEEAEAELLRLREAHPHEVQIAIALAQFYEDQQRWDEAIDTHKLVGSLDTSLDGDSLTRIGTILLVKRSKPDDALFFLNEALPLCDDDPVNVLLQIARTYEILQDETNSIATYEEIEKVLRSQHKQKTSNTILRRYGWYFYKTGDFVKANNFCNMVEGELNDLDKLRSILILMSIAHLQGTEKPSNFQIQTTGITLTDELAWEAIHDIKAVNKRLLIECDLQSFIDVIQSVIV
jgi:tetratricopeptide (TPR) repeat protein